jgi:T5SS/PEP-CTERM-associated repeat protein
MVAAMKRHAIDDGSHPFCRTLCALPVSLLILMAAVQSARADIVVTGDTDPADTSFWIGGGDSDTNGSIGFHAGGTLAVDGGSVLSIDEGILGHDAGVTGSATFGGAAQWNLDNDLEVGRDGIGFLDIFSAASVTAGDDIYIGYNEGGEGTVVVDGDGSLLKAVDNLVVGNDGTGDLTIRNQADASGGDVYIGNGATSSGTVLVTGGGATLHSDNELRVGNAGFGSLTIQDGAEVTSGTVSLAYVGVDSEGEVLVEGEGSRWTNLADFVIGDDGMGTVVVRNGGAISAGDTIIGQYDGASGSLTVETTITDSTASFTADGSLNLASNVGANGSLTVQGAGAEVIVNDDIQLGFGGTGTLNILDGGVVSALSSVVVGLGGHDELTDMDVLGTGDIVVSGAGSLLDVTNDVVLGNGGTGSLTVNDSATVTAERLILANGPGFQGTIIVDGADTDLDLTYDLLVGREGTGTATFRNGATVTSEDATVGSEDGSHGKLNIESGATYTTGNITVASVADEIASIGDITVTGEGSRLASSGDIVVGGAGTGSFTVSDSAAVTAVSLILAEVSGSTGTLIAEGADTTVDLDDLNVGPGGTGMATLRDGVTVTSDQTEVGIGGGSQGTLNIQSGATLTTGYVSIAAEVFSTGGVTVTGGGSLLSASGDIDVGGAGTGSLIVSDGGTVGGDSMVIARDEGSVGTVSVTGAESSLTIDGGLRVGVAGVGTLTVADGAMVAAGDTVIGSDSSSAGSSLTVTGAGSRFSSSVNLTVGDAGSATVDILDGGVIDVTGSVYMGDNVATAAVNIRGEGSTWSAGEDMNIGPSQTSTVNVYQGGTVSTGWNLNIGAHATFNVFVDGDGMIQTGTAGNPDEGDLNNEGRVNLVATASLGAGTYTPIKVGADRSFNGGGTYTAIGGSWNGVTHEFTVGAITTDGTGDLSGKRVQYDDGLVVSFADSVGEVAFSVTAIAPGTIEGEDVLSAYTFSTTLVDTPTGLSFLLPDGYTWADINLWQSDDPGVGWTAIDHGNFQVDGNTVSLLVSELGSYAVTALASVPEPASWGALAGMAAMGFAMLRRRKRG